MAATRCTIVPIDGHRRDPRPATRSPSSIARRAASRRARRSRIGDCLVVTQKIVSKAEGRLVDLDPDDIAARHRLVESESVRIVRRRGDLVISETRHGFVCANAGIDLSNVEAGQAALLPVDPDRSAKHIRDAVRARAGVEVGGRHLRHVRTARGGAASPTSRSA